MYVSHCFRAKKSGGEEFKKWALFLWALIQIAKSDANQILLKLARMSVSCSYHFQQQKLWTGTQTNLFMVFEIFSFLKIIL